LAQNNEVMFIQIPKIKILAVICVCLLIAGEVSARKNPVEPISTIKKKQPFSMDEQTRSVANEVMLTIFQDILGGKKKYKALEQFDESALFKNEHGIYAIVYQYQGSERQMRRHPFEFGLTLTDMDNTIFEDKGKYAFNFGFPMIRMKFAGFQHQSAKHRYNLGKVINVRGIPLSDHQQNYMPLKLKLKTIKDVYKIYDPIHFVVELENVSQRHMWVKSLNDKTLYCLFNNQVWGTNQIGPASAKTHVLKYGKRTDMEFSGKGFKRPKDFEIYCSYNMAIDGIKPSGLLKIKVIK